MTNGQQLTGLDDDCFVGNVVFANRFIKVEHAIMIGNWIICMELSTILDSRAIGAFNAGTHYTFTTVDDETNLEKTLFDWFIANIYPIMIPGMSQSENVVAVEYFQNGKNDIVFRYE
jgi:hypothetical protein